MTVAPTISVIIPHYNDLVGLDLCLVALQGQTLPADQFEIIICDNNSPQGMAAVQEVVGDRAQLILVVDKGAGPARNGGAKIARGTIFAFIDSDCVAEPDWLVQGLRGLANHDFIGGKVRVLLADPARMSPTEAFERVFAFDFKTYIEKKGFTGAGNMFCPRIVFERVGGFETGVSEDVEWSLRATGKGFRLGYAPDAIVGHPARRSWADLWLKWRRVNAETYGLLRTQRGGELKWLARCAALLPSAIIHTPKVLLSEELNTLGQRMAALGVLYRLRAWRFADSLRLVFSRGT